MQSVRGMPDVLPVDVARWQLVENVFQQTLHGYAYEEVRIPIIEFAQLFSRGLGEATDAVEKEMFSVVDRDGDQLALRPEGTAGTARCLDQHGLLYNQTQRVYYQGPMFRYDRPQKGRYRQFQAFGAEVFGLAGPDIDAELIQLNHEIWKQLGIESAVQLELNTLGSGSDRQAYKKALVSFLTPLKSELDEDSQRRLATNPLRILDSKTKSTQELLQGAPDFSDFLGAEGKHHFTDLRNILDELQINYVVNTRLVRGLDYYTNTVFEWITDQLGSQGTICGGGRYDGLVSLLGGKETPGVGFAAGIDRVVLLHEMVHSQATTLRAPVDVYFIAMDNQHVGHVLKLAQHVRDQLPEFRVRVHAGGGKLQKQMKKANDSGAQWVLLVGEEEIEAGKVSVKQLRMAGEQLTLTLAQVVELISAKTLQH